MYKRLGFRYIMKIIKAAIKGKDGYIYLGKNHSQIIAAHEFGKFKGCEQGFFTDTGQFVGREKAAEIAFEAGQIDRRCTLLFSEDIKDLSCNSEGDDV